MQSDFNPYQQWLGIDGPGPPNHYQLLGVPDFEADPERIWSSAHKRRAVLQAKQYSDDAQLAARLISEVDAAERCLLSPYDKEQYDQQLRSAAAAAEQAAAAQAADAAPLAEPAHPPEKKPSSNWGYDDDSPAPMRPEDFLPPPASPGDFVPPAAFGQPSPQPGAPVAGMPPYGQPLPPTAGDPMPGGQAPMAAMPGDPANGFGTPVAGLPPAATPAEPFPPAEPPMAEVLGTAPMASPLFPQAPMANPGYDPLPKAPSPAAPAPLAGTPVPAASVPPSATMGTPVANPMPSAVAAAQAADDFPLPAAAPLGTAPSAQPEPAGPHVVAPGRRWAPARSNSLFLAVGAPVAAVVIIGLLVLFVTESGPFGSGPVAKKSVSTDPGKRPEPPAPIPTPKPMPKPPEPKSNSDLGPKPPEPKPPEPKPKLPEPKTPDPKPKPPEPKPKADPGQMKLVTTALLSARYWLADRDLDKADEAYALAKKNDPTGARRDDLEGVRELIHYNREFWKAVRGQCKDLKGGSIIRLQGQNVGVVEAREDYLILREAGRNKRYTFKAMKVGYAYDLAALFLTKSDPVTHVILGAFLVAEYEGDRDQARGHWQTAMRTGDEDLQKQVELLLPTLAVKIPAEPVPLPGEEPAGPQRGPDGRYPLPEGDVLAKAQAAVTEMYKPRIDAAVFEADKAALARDVLKEADGDDVDPTTRFVLLGQARDLAAAGEDFPLAMQTVDALAESYVVDAMAMKIDLIAAGAKSVKDPEASKALVKLALEYADEAVLLEQFSLALRLTNAARTAAAKSKDPALIKEAASRHKEITALKSSS